LHDSCNLEGSGLPALVVATSAFVQAAEVQSKALGHEPTMVWVPHPIQDRTDGELRGIADSAFDEIVARTTASR
jgi:hypothetical protein